MAYDLMAKEFPDYEQITLPSIPEGWQDSSWHNDSCPCFIVGRDLNPLMIYIDYAKVEDREMRGGSRFSVLKHHEDGWEVVELLSTDDWHAVLDCVREHQA